VPNSDSENVYVLIPLAPGLEDTDIHRENLFRIIISQIEKKSQISNLQKYLVYKKSYSLDDFSADYNAYKGNAYGLSNVLSQTAFGKPSQKSLTLDNLYFTGQLTSPGPGIPPCLISGLNVSKLIEFDINGSKFSKYIYYLFIRITVFIVVMLNYLFGKF